MPYRRLPNTDQARVRALRTAIAENERRVEKNDVMLPFGLVQDAKSFLNRFEKSLAQYKQALDAQVSANKSFQHETHAARIYISHFIQVLNLAVVREDIKKDRKMFYGLDPDKIPEVEKRISDSFDENRASFMGKLKEGLDVVTKIRDEVLPGAPVVMGEGTSCCTCDKILFEEHSDAFWKMLEEQALLLRGNGLWGTVVRTGSSPVDISWNMRAGSFRKVNLLFLNGAEG